MTTTPASPARYSKLGFEIQTCSRCHGCGEYSYNAMTGRTCFGCGGSGVTFTKRGAAANAFYLESLKAPVESIVVGDLVWYQNISTSYFVTVKEISPGVQKHKTQDDGPDSPWREIETIEFKATHATRGNHGLSVRPGGMVRKGWDGPTKAAKRAEAVAYQSTLTKAGKPMKVA